MGPTLAIRETAMIPALLGDVGATKTVLALAVVGPRGTDLEPGTVERVESRAFFHLSELVTRYLERHPAPKPRWACLGVPGPVMGGRCRTTNLPWELDARQLAAVWGLEGVVLLNDLAALAWAFAWEPLPAHRTLREGTPEAGAPRLVAAVGTGLGAALVVPGTGGPAVLPSEAGHCDFSPKSAEDWEVATWLRAELGGASYEQLVSGPGLARLYTFFAGKNAPAGFFAAEDQGAWVVRHAETDPCCSRAVSASARYLARFLGDLALVTLPFGGIFLAGSVIAGLARWLATPEFFQAFQDKGPQAGLLARVPIHLVEDPLAALRGCGRALTVALAAGITPG